MYLREQQMMAQRHLPGRPGGSSRFLHWSGCFGHLASEPMGAKSPSLFKERIALERTALENNGRYRLGVIGQTTATAPEHATVAMNVNEVNWTRV